MNKYGEIDIQFYPGSEDWTVKEGIEEMSEASAKNCPEDTDGWDYPDGYEMGETIVDAGQKLLKEIGYSNIIANGLNYIYWHKMPDNKPSDYYHDEILLVVYFDKDQKRFETGTDSWDKNNNNFVYYNDNSVIYWAELPQPPIQT